MKLFHITLIVFTGLTLQAQSAAPNANILSKEESLTLENIQLRSVIINQEMQELQAKTAEARASIEKAHPGYTLGQTSQGFQLMKTPEPPKDAKKPAPAVTPAPSPKK
jgi:hypothetical protein